MHRVTYSQIINALKEADESLWFDELNDRLPSDPDVIVLQDKLDKMVGKGTITCSKEMRYENIFGTVVGVENRRYSLSDETKALRKNDQRGGKITNDN